MMAESCEEGGFGASLRCCLSRQTEGFASRKVNRRDSVYTCGEVDASIYFIERGQVKLMLTSASGKECLLAIYCAGDIFGELCLAGIAKRQSTAVAMEDCVLKRMPCADFLALLRVDDLVEGLALYLAGRLVGQQRTIAELMTVDSEHRLGETLLRLAEQIGKHDPRSLRIEQRISHQDLSEMVGTTRPRITKFMGRFHALGLIETTAQRHLIVKEKKLRGYLDSAFAPGSNA